jgi:recombination DNA repair RAD52 pathway protein
MQHTQADTCFSEETLSELKKPLDKRLISERKGSGGTTLKYVEVHDIVDQANRILGYGLWGYEPLYVKQEVLLDPVTQEPVGIAYKAAVRLQVQGCEPITDVGSQAVTSWNIHDVVMSRRKAGDNSPLKDTEVASARHAIMDAHEMAEKAAVSDALKRCFFAYGAQFGNALRGKKKPEVRMATAEQMKRINAYCQHINREQPQGELIYEEADRLLRELVEEYNVTAKEKSA